MARKNQALHVGPNMTPMVDIVMCILIFFMLGSSFAAPELFLPSVAAEVKKGLNNQANISQLPKFTLTIKLDKVGSSTNVTMPGAPETTLTPADPGPTASSSDVAQAKQDRLNQEQTFFQILQAKKKALPDDLQVFISPASGVPYQDVISTYDNCLHAGFAHVAFMTTR